MQHFTTRRSIGWVFLVFWSILMITAGMICLPRMSFAAAGSVATETSVAAGESVTNCQGCCSYHGGVVCRNGITMCADGTSLSETCVQKGCNACEISLSQLSSYSSTQSSQPLSQLPSLSLARMEQVHRGIRLRTLYYKLKEGQPLLRDEQELFARYDNDFTKLQAELFDVTPPRSIKQGTGSPETEQALPPEVLAPEVLETKAPDRGTRDAGVPDRSLARWRERWCSNYHGQVDVPLSDGTPCDCLVTIDGIDYAVTIEYGARWAAAIGQALYNAAQTARMPGIVLVLGNEQEYKYFFRLNKALTYHHLSFVKTWALQDY